MVFLYFYRIFSRLSIHLYLLTIHPSVRPSIHPTVHPSIRPSVRPSVHSSVRSLIHQSIQPCTHLHIISKMHCKLQFNHHIHISSPHFIHPPLQSIHPPLQSIHPSIASKRQHSQENKHQVKVINHQPLQSLPISSPCPVFKNQCHLNDTLMTSHVENALFTFVLPSCRFHGNVNKLGRSQCPLRHSGDRKKWFPRHPAGDFMLNVLLGKLKLPPGGHIEYRLRK